MVSRIFKKYLNAFDTKKILRFQLTAVMATTIDFLITIILKENFHWHYTVAVGFGAGAGAITAFSINRFWVFRSIERNAFGQLFRYLMIAVGSVFLNTIGTYLLTEYLLISYLISKAVIALIIGFTYSYYFSKRFVFYA